MKGMGLYILKDKEPIYEPNPSTWASWLEATDRKVASTMIGDISVSTVFLGVDHNFHSDGPPILFETMVFGEYEDGNDMDRYSTWEEAEAGHKMMVDTVKLREQARLQS